MSSKDRKKQNQTEPKQSIQKPAQNAVWVWFVLSVVFITTFFIYFKAGKFDVLHSWDDQLYIRENSHIQHLNWTNIKLFFSSFYAGNYQPITMLLYALEYKIGASKASIFHFSNIIFHLFNTYFVFVLIKKISPKNMEVALITAAFFAIHPMHVESIAWVSETKDVLYSFFFLLSLIVYSNYLNSNKPKQLLYVGILFILSSLSKSAAVVLPLVMLLMDYYTDRKFDRKVIVEKIPFFLISFVFGVIAIYSQKSAGAIENMAPSMSTMERISVVSYSFVRYLFKAFLPTNLSPIYPYPVELGGILPLKFYLSILFVGGILFFTWHSRKWGKDIIFGSLFFISTILLVLQFFPIGAASMAERYTYIPYIGIFFILGKLYERFFILPNPMQKYKTYSLAILVIAFFAFSTITYGRVKIWENEDTLFSDVINKYPDSKIAYRGRGMYLMNYHTYVGNDNNKKENLEKAIADLENSLKFASTKKDSVQAYYDLGIARSGSGDFINAIEEYTKSLEINPRFARSYNNRGTCYISHYVLNVYANDSIKKNIYLKMAIADYENSLKYELNREDKAKSYCNLGDARNRLGDFSGALRNFDKGINLRANIDYGVVYVNRGCVKYFFKDYQGALQDFNKAIELHPQDNNAIANRNLVQSIINNAVKT